MKMLLLKLLNYYFRLPFILIINCYFHYKKDIIDYFSSFGFTKKKNNELYLKSKIVINILGKLLLEYNGILDYIDNKFPEFVLILENYFKFKYFKIGDYNYNKTPINYCTNSYLENYNLCIKKILGNKLNLSWIKFINFIKEESQRIRLKLTYNI